MLVFLCGFFALDSRGKFGWDVLCFFAFLILLPYTLSGFVRVGEVSWDERRDFRVLKGDSILTVEMGSEYRVFKDIASYNASSNAEVIYVKKKWNQFGFPLEDEWHFIKD